MNDSQADITYYLYSKYLKKKKRIDIFLPQNYLKTDEGTYNLVLMNDGQDAPRLRLAETLRHLHRERMIEEVIWVGIHADADRMHEYGVAKEADYANRGDRADAYTQFIVQELLPFLHIQFEVSVKPSDTAFVGFSLGALSAFDIVWQHPHIFGKVGAFSASFWWRSKALDDGYTDSDRIMHRIVREGSYQQGLKFWFEVGTRDETSDRNNSGIIDAIEDTLDLIQELESKGYTGTDIKYVEIQEGEHNPETWAKVLPNFTLWAFPRKSHTHHSGKVFL